MTNQKLTKLICFGLVAIMSVTAFASCTDSGSGKEKETDSSVTTSAKDEEQSDAMLLSKVFTVTEITMVRRFVFLRFPQAVHGIPPLVILQTRYGSRTPDPMFFRKAYMNATGRRRN